MSACCTITTVPFVNQSSTTVPYTGDKPTVATYYNIDGVWQTVASPITYGESSVTVQHGSDSATGVIKLVQ